MGHLTAVALLFTLSAQDDWPMWGGRPDRNMVSEAKDLPATWDPGKDVAWTADLGEETFSTPVVAGGRVFIGTNNDRPRDPARAGDKGVLMCFSAKDGTFLWQAVHDKLPAGDAEDYKFIGVCSTPAVVGDSVYYVSNRGELICCDAEGFRDGENDGPEKGEARRGPTDPDVLWRLDLRKELGVVPNQASASSPLVVGDRVFVVTGNGRGYRTGKVANPDAPSFIAVDRKTGKVAWSDNSPGDRIVEGQWGSPAYGEVDGIPQVAFPGGDGVLYVFDPDDGKLRWKFQCATRPKNHLLATPVYVGHRVIVPTGANPNHGDGEGCLRVLDARKGKELWRLEGKEFGRSLSSVAVRDGLVYAAEAGGYLGCIELDSGRRLWRADCEADIWGSPLVADGKVYIRNFDGDVRVFAEGREEKLLATNTLPGLRHGTVVASGGMLYVSGTTRLYAIGKK